MQPAQVDVSVWKFVLYVCVTGSHGNHEHGLVKIQEAPCFFKLNGYMYTYGCVCVCIYAPNHQCSSLNCWHSEFKASSFSSRQKYPDLHLFFLPALFRCPISTPGAEKKKSFQTSKFKNTRQAQPWHGPLEVFWLFLPFVWGGFFETLRLGNKHRCRWSFVIGSVLPARWTAVC